jgi:hypothetical protein
LKRRNAIHSLAYTQATDPVKKAERDKIGWLKDTSARPSNARRPKDEQQRIAAIGVWPLFVFPSVDLRNLLPYCCASAKRVLLETKRPVLLKKLSLI